MFWGRHTVLEGLGLMFPQPHYPLSTFLERTHSALLPHTPACLYKAENPTSLIVLGNMTENPTLSVIPWAPRDSGLWFLNRRRWGNRLATHSGPNGILSDTSFRTSLLIPKHCRFKHKILSVISVAFHSLYCSNLPAEILRLVVWMRELLVFVLFVFVFPFLSMIATELLKCFKMRFSQVNYTS